MEKNIISTATINNWARLGVDAEDINNKLSKRANKRCSVKNIIPLEYFSDKKNMILLDRIISYVKENNCNIRSIIYTLAIKFLINMGLVELDSKYKIISRNKYLGTILEEYGTSIDKILLNMEYPLQERDFLGLVYQSLLKEGTKNVKGAYYTPEIILDFIKDKLRDDSLYLDPCCGTGSFLLAAAEKIVNPENLYGCDIDENACFISKINLIVKYRNIEFNPKIFNMDFISEKKLLKDVKFDVIATNPPWGAMTKDNYCSLYPEISSNESFSYFIVKSYSFIKENGYCAFVLPESVLNVAVHKDIREFILNKYCLKSIYFLGRTFEGVLTNVVFLELFKSSDTDNIKIVKNECENFVSSGVYKNNKNFTFSLMTNRDAEIINKIYLNEYETLSNSFWGLGIVTGNNRKHLKHSSTTGEEPIYTGKEISKYFLRPAKNFVLYNRSLYQQTAPDSLYRAKEKLVYKFISKNLVFAYDNQGSLFLNSANILIPNMETHSIKTVLAFLNSELFNYIYMKKFGGIKILKCNLLQLPFIKLSVSEKAKLEYFVNALLANYDTGLFKEIDDFVYKLFKLGNDDIKYIKQMIC